MLFCVEVPSHLSAVAAEAVNVGRVKEIGIAANRPINKVVVEIRLVNLFSSNFNLLTALGPPDLVGAQKSAKRAKSSLLSDHKTLESGEQIVS